LLRTQEKEPVFATRKLSKSSTRERNSMMVRTAIHQIRAQVAQNSAHTGSAQALLAMNNCHSTTDKCEKRNMLAATRPSTKVLAECIGYLNLIQTSSGWPEPLTTPFRMPDGRSVPFEMTPESTPTKSSSAFASTSRTGRFPTTLPQAKKPTPKLW
jgi:hypothetical protein